MAMVGRLSPSPSPSLSLAVPPPSLKLRAPPRNCVISRSKHTSPALCFGLSAANRKVAGRRRRLKITWFVPKFQTLYGAGSCDSLQRKGLPTIRCTVGSQGAQLPAKLQEIVGLFQAVEEPRAKYEQLLYYAKQLKPLAKEHLTSENKVHGCVSQVWVVSTLAPDRTVYFEAESDSSLTKGLAALLVEGLSGATVEEIVKITPDFVHMLGLKQSLTPSRSNGFLNMLKLMQKKTLQLCMDPTQLSSVPNSCTTGSSANEDVGNRQDGSEVVSSTLAPEPPVSQSKMEIIKKKLAEGLKPAQLEVEDVSYQHAGHAGVATGSSETHFNVKVISNSFKGKSLVKRHRLVYELLHDDLQTGGVHALSLITKTPSEVAGKT